MVLVFISQITLDISKCVWIFTYQQNEQKTEVSDTKFIKLISLLNSAEFAEFSPEEMRPYKREFQYQGCKL